MGEGKADITINAHGHDEDAKVLIQSTKKYRLSQKKEK